MTQIAGTPREPGTPARPRRPATRRITILSRVTAAALLSGGLTLAAVAPAQAATTITSAASAPSAASGDTYVAVSHPSQHCTYYHHVVNGAWRGVAYKCTANESGDKPYRAWIVCEDDFHGTEPKYYGKTVRKPTQSQVDCLVNQSPKVGGYNNPA